MDYNYVESSLESENENAFNLGMNQKKRENEAVRIIYNPAKNKSKSLGRVGLGN